MFDGFLSFFFFFFFLLLFLFCCCCFFCVCFFITCFFCPSRNFFTHMKTLFLLQVYIYNRRFRILSSSQLPTPNVTLDICFMMSSTCDIHICCWTFWQVNYHYLFLTRLGFEHPTSEGNTQTEWATSAAYSFV